ncbi:MAG: LysR family transcriptional regulator [Polyangiaceae bacterium]|jgi:DNA-binding transcriptional LysR family regulator|nr:LysR family transcriptional regulator [Polyangiaceae bacterium]
MTFDQLCAFHAVATRGTFAAAAKALHKSQPAITKLVQNLESELDVVLFDRAAYRATLTDAGRRFLERAAQVVADTESLTTYGRALGRGAEPQVRLVIEAITPLRPVLAALSRVRAAFPLVRLELRTERLAGTVETLTNGSADLVIANAEALERRKMQAMHFARVRIVPVVRRDHPLAQAGSPAPLAALREHPQVVLTDSARVEPAPPINVVEGGLRWTVTDVTAKLQIIEAGLGWGGLPEHVVRAGIRKGTLAALSVHQFETEVIELVTLRHKERAQGPVARALWDELGARPGRTSRSAEAPGTKRG